MTAPKNSALAPVDESHPLKWLDALDKFETPADFRASLAKRYPAFAPGQLNSLAIVGAADEGVRLAELCATRGLKVLAVGDDNPDKRGLKIGASTVSAVEELSRLDKSTPIVIASHRLLKATDRLRSMGFANVAPFALLQVLDPARFPPHMFYDGWFEDLAANREKYRSLARALADDMSRRVLDAVIGFRVTLDPSELRPVIEWDLYGPANLLHFSDDEVYVDGGSFDGDTIRLFIDRVRGKFARVLAFEPDKNTFQRLAANFATESRVQPWNAGLHRRKAVLRFDNAGTRGSILIESGGIEVPVVGLDEVLRDDRVTFVKMNIEGAELEALRGARGAIQRWSPKLAISAYHRPTDLWEIPQLVRDLNPNYRLYMRQHDGGVIETVLYGLS